MSSMETRITAPNGAGYAVVWRKDRPQGAWTAAYDVYQITAANEYREVDRGSAAFARVMLEYAAMCVESPVAGQAAIAPTGPDKEKKLN